MRIRVFSKLNGCIFLGYGKGASNSKKLRAIGFHLLGKAAVQRQHINLYITTNIYEMSTATALLGYHF
ncbi:hypothetical protein QUB70_00720 [Microcoleus sp. A003_D6]|uniref:hypothetical protein n=1 Tax=Microcoleus sp. A003_D6 TaxID=3055266 RepID=UPI002FD63736